MRISMNHDFERRVGIWPAGFDADGELFCNQRYGDWPMAAEGDPWRSPAWMLLSAGKKATASSFVDGHEPGRATEENVRSWWRAASENRSEWLQIDLGQVFDVHAIQINFADDHIDIPCPGRIVGGSQARYIEERDLTTQWKLTGSIDGPMRRPICRTTLSCGKRDSGHVSCASRIWQCRMVSGLVSPDCGCSVWDRARSPLCLHSQPGGTVIWT